MQRNKKTGVIGIIITIVILIILVIATNINISEFSKAEGFFGKFVMPIQNGLTFLKNKIAGNDTFFQNINNLKDENERLDNENKELKEKLGELAIIKAENSILREYSKMTEKHKEYSTVPAYIIDKDITNLSETIIINVGEEQGVSPNMPVIAGEGLVGFIVSVTETTSKVQPIIDPASSASSNISTSRDTVVAKGILGDYRNLKLAYIPTEADLVLEDNVETSGLGRNIS